MQEIILKNYSVNSSVFDVFRCIQSQFLKFPPNPPLWEESRCVHFVKVSTSQQPQEAGATGITSERHKLAEARKRERILAMAKVK